MPTPDLPEFDAALAAAAFDKLRRRLDALPEPAVPARADVRPLVAAALAAHQESQPLRSRLTRLPKEEFDPGTLDALKDAAWALWHTRAELDKALAPADPQLPADLLERAAALKERMLRVCKYWLEDDAAVAPVLGSMTRRKTAPADLASDLRRLSGLYRAHQKVLAADVKHFRAGDAADAEAVAGEIEKILSAVGADAVRTWTTALSRAQALLLAVHEDLRATALWLSRKEPGAAEKFPSLAALPAPRGRPRKSAGAPTSEPPPAPAAEDAANGASPEPQ